MGPKAPRRRRAGTQTRWSFGDDESALVDYAWYGVNTADVNENHAHQVGLKKPNAFGLYDMHGNVFEWCHDYLVHSYYKRSAEKDPTGPVAGSWRVLRGGSWCYNSHVTRSAYRRRGEPHYRNIINGFRLVRELD